MARVLFCNELGGGTGHLHRQGSLARSFAARGHQVLMAVKDPASANRLFPRLELPFVASPAWLGVVPPETPPAINYAQLLLRVGYRDPGQLAGLVAGWLGLFTLHRPQLLVVDHAPSALLAARIAGIESAHVGTGFLVPPELSPMPSLQPWRGIPNSELLASELQLLRVINQVLERHDSNPLGSLPAMFDASLPYLMTFPELDHYGARDSVRYWGNVQAESIGASPRWPELPGERLFVYLKAGVPQGRQLLLALQKMRLPTLVVAPDLPQGQREELARPHLRFSEGLVNSAELAGEAQLAITNGGHGMVSQLLLQGVPQLLLPRQLEQGMLAHRMQRQELGRSLSGDQPIEPQLRQALDDDAMRIAVREFARRYREWSPQQQLERVVTAMEHQLGGRRI